MLGGARMEVIFGRQHLRRKMNKYVHTSRITLSIRYIGCRYQPVDA